jgi:carbon monoxide dehydrogenase subunit G
MTLLGPSRAGKSDSMIENSSVKLEFSGSPEIAAPRERVWQRLIDARFVARSAPGVEGVRVIDSTHFQVTSGFGIGPLRARVVLDGELFDLVPGVSAKMLLRGQGPGSTFDVCTGIEIHEAGSGRLRLNWLAITELTGTLAKAGTRLIEGIARRLTEQFWADFARRVAEE